MKTGLIISIAFIILICGNAVLIANDAGAEKRKPAAGDSISAAKTPADTSVFPEPTGESEKTVVYYFHGTRRCPTCRKLEAYSREAIETGFVKELEKGELEFLPVNFDDEENRHYIKDYELFTKSLIVCDFENGKQAKWKNLNKIWELVGDKDEFVKYVQSELRAYLEED